MSKLYSKDKDPKKKDKWGHIKSATAKNKIEFYEELGLSIDENLNPDITLEEVGNMYGDMAVKRSMFVDDSISKANASKPVSTKAEDVFAERVKSKAPDYFGDFEEPKDYAKGLELKDKVMIGLGAMTIPNTGATIYNMKEYGKAIKAIGEEGTRLGLTGEELNKFKTEQMVAKEIPLSKTGRFASAVGDATKNSLLVGKSKISPYGSGISPEGKLYYGSNITKTASLFRNKKGTINLGGNKPTTPPPPVDVQKKPFLLGEGKTPVSTESNLLVNSKGQKLLKEVPKQKLISDVSSYGGYGNSGGKTQSVWKSGKGGTVPPPSSKSGNLNFGIDLGSDAAKKVYKAAGKVAKGVVKNIPALMTAASYGLNEQEAIDKYGVGANAVVSNIINTGAEMINPMNYARLAATPTQIAANVFEGTGLGVVAGAAADVQNKVIDTVEGSVKDNFSRRLEQEQRARTTADEKVFKKKMKDTPDYTGLDIKKAGLYGDTKKSGLDALNKISDSTGIPTEVLLREGKKMWSKKKK